MFEWIAELTATYERLTAGWPEWAVTVAGVVLLLAAAWIGDTVVRRQLTSSLRLIVGRTAGRWDDALIDHGVINRLSHVIPAIIVFFGVGLVPGIDESWRDGIRNAAQAYAAFIAVRAVAAALTAANTIYERRPGARRRPIKGYIQLATLFAYCCGAILIISALLGKSPFVLLTGFGALTAVLLLVFRDTILSLVASVQLSSLDMVRVGDWIEMPKFNADGDVIDIELHTVRVQNWDKTITTIPTHRLITESFQNWRGMSESGGRRIKRSLVIDIASIRFLESAEIEHFRRMVLLSDYLAEKEQALSDYNEAIDADTDEAVNLRRLTNIGTFRAYALNYLRRHPQIHKSMTLLVRQLQPTAEGLPIEIYCFTTTTAWGEYEAIQSDIFDHLLAVLHRFGLKAYQLPSNDVVEALVPAVSRDSRGLS
ncbi:MAG: mechanosensitive ion channel domain-containing protein [Pseudomonadota bacterium]